MLRLSVVKGSLHHCLTDIDIFMLHIKIMWSLYKTLSLPRRPRGILLVYGAQVHHWRELSECLCCVACGCICSWTWDAGSQRHCSHCHHTGPTQQPHHDRRELWPSLRRHTVLQHRGSGDIILCTSYRAGRCPGGQSSKMSSFSGHFLAEKSKSVQSKE